MSWKGFPGRGAILSIAMCGLIFAAVSNTAVAAQQPSAGAPAPPQEPTVDVSKLPLDLMRIERQLRQASEREEFDGMRLRYFVDVFGRAPQIELFAPDENLSSGPVPWGAPTHQQMLDIMTPQEFRSPPMDFANFLRWLSDKTKK